MKTFHELHAANINPEALRSEIDTKGYALIRNLIPQDSIRSVLADVTRILSTEKWLSPTADSLQRIPQHSVAYGDPDPVFKRVYQDVFNLESFHALPHQPALQRAMKMIVGDRIVIHAVEVNEKLFAHTVELGAAAASK